MFLMKTIVMELLDKKLEQERVEIDTGYGNVLSSIPGFLLEAVVVIFSEYNRNRNKW